jgi:hypothetical protein
MAKKIIRLTESDLARIVKRVLSENIQSTDPITQIQTCLTNKGVSTELPKACVDAINKVMNNPTGEIPNITDPVFIQCGTALGFTAFSVGPKIIECLTEIKPDSTENVVNP